MEHIMNKQSATSSPIRPPVFHARAATLDADAARLLRILGQAGAYAIRDPLDETCLVARTGGSGVSLGAGRFPAMAGEALLAADLAEAGGGPRARLTLSAAGRARLRRQEASGGGHHSNLRFLAQHTDIEGREGEDRPLRDASESPLAWMARRRGRDGEPLIDAACFEAGERLRRDLTTAALVPRLGARFGEARVDGGGPRDPAAASDAIVAARQRVRQALAAVGDDLSGLLIDLCGFLKGLERIEAERRWPARSAKVVIRIALSRLAEHYGLEREARGRESGRMRLWRDDGL